VSLFSYSCRALHHATTLKVLDPSVPQIAWYGEHFRQNFTLEDAIGSHACSLEALAGV
jgi:hypothetical protein